MLALRGPGAGQRRAFFEELVGELGRVHVTAREEAERTARARARKRKQRREVRACCAVAWLGGREAGCMYGGGLYDACACDSNGSIKQIKNNKDRYRHLQSYNNPLLPNKTGPAGGPAAARRGGAGRQARRRGRRQRPARAGQEGGQGGCVAESTYDVVCHLTEVAVGFHACVSRRHPPVLDGLTTIPR